MRVPLLLLLLAPALAGAQTVELSYADNPATVRTRTVGPGDCDDTVTVNYTVTSSTAYCSDLNLWVTTAANCNDGPQDTDHTFVTVSRQEIQPQGSGKFSAGALPAFGPNGDQRCGAANVEATFQVCAQFTAAAPNSQFCLNNDNDVTARATPLKVVYDAKPPAKPSIVGVGALDGELRVTVESEAGTTVRVEARVPGTQTVVSQAVVGRDVRTVSVTGLQNNTRYEVRAFAVDAAGNEAESEPVEGTPVETRGFWAAYKEAGGQEQGGCASAGGLLGPLAVLSVVFLRRRRS